MVQNLDLVLVSFGTRSKMKKQWAIIDKKNNHRVSIHNTKEEADLMIEKYMHIDEMQVEEYIPFDGNEGIYARGDVGIGRTYKHRKGEA
jgi:hypothetical protein